MILQAHAGIIGCSENSLPTLEHVSSPWQCLELMECSCTHAYTCTMPINIVHVRMWGSMYKILRYTHVHTLMHVDVCSEHMKSSQHVRGEVRVPSETLGYSCTQVCSQACMYMGKYITQLLLYLLKRTSTLLWSNAGLGLFLEEKRREDASSSVLNRTSTTDNPKAYGVAAGRRSKLMLPTFWIKKSRIKWRPELVISK